jgi:hypothetical protein
VSDVVSHALRTIAAVVLVGGMVSAAIDGDIRTALGYALVSALWAMTFVIDRGHSDGGTR